MFAALGLPVLLVAGPFDGALRLVPDSANVLVLVDVKAVHASPVGQREDWADKTKQRYRSAGGVMAPGSERVLIAGQAHLADARWDWQAAVVDGPDAPDVPELIRRERGELDGAAGRSFVLSPRGAYFVPMGPSRLVVFHPADRQALARWLRHSQAAGKQPAPAVSPYLAEAAGQAARLPLVIAMDLTDAVDPNVARRGLAGLVSLANKKVDHPSFARALAGVRGLTFTAEFGEHIEATLRVDFSPGIGEYRSVLKAVFLEILESAGAAIPELADWKGTYPDSSMVLSGPLSPASLTQIVGLFAFPQAESAAPLDAQAGPTKAATKRYFETVNEIVEGVRSLKQDRRYDKMALWHETAAKKIEQLNPRGVDPDALAYGSDVAQRLRAIAGSLRGVPIDLDKLKSEGYFYATQYTSGWGWWRWQSAPDVRTNLPQVQAKMAKVVTDDEKARQQLWGEISERGSKTRAALSRKYMGF